MKFISVPSFNKDSDDTETELEQNIINQLLFSEDSKDFPDSRIKE